MLGIYAAWTVLIFRFLRRAGASEGVAWVTALACTFTLPVAAFPFQHYPELVAGLLVTAVASHLLFASADHRRRAFVIGLLAGYLPWLHVRFSAVTIAFALRNRHLARRSAGGCWVSLAALPCRWRSSPSTPTESPAA